MKNPVLPRFKKNYCTLVFSSSEEYVPYLAVALKSLEACASKEINYDVVIMENKMSQQSMKKITNLFCKNNISIRFYDISNLLKEDDFCVRGHLSVETFFKFFIPDIFSKFDKVLFMDSDIIIRKDPSELYSIDLHGFSMAASLCCLWNGIANTDDCMIKYAKNILKLDNINKYFQCGILLMDIKKMKVEKISELCLKKAAKKMYTCMDQDVFNMVYNGKIFFFDNCWNYETRQKGFSSSIPEINKEIKLKYDKAQENPYIIHYSGREKPWIYPDEEFADVWWTYARQTPFYELLLERMIHFKILEKQQVLKTYLINLRNYNRNKFRSLKYKIMYFMTLGKKRQKYKEKYRKNKQILMSTIEFLKSV